MRLVGRATMSLLLIAALALAGCSGGADGGGGEKTTSKSSTTGKATTGPRTSGGPTTAPTSGTGGPGGGTGDNNPPVGTIKASIEKGPVPVRVNFTLTGTDQDGDDLSWNIDLDGDGKTDKSGEELPATVSHNYTAVGVYNVTYALSDGTDTQTYRQAINVTAAASGEGPTIVLSGTYLAGTPDVCVIGGPEFSGGTSNGLNQVDMDPTPDVLGKHFKATWTGVTAPAVSFNVVILSQPDSTNFVTTMAEYSSNTPELEGDIPSGDVGNMVSSSCAGAGNPITVTWEIA